MRAAESTSGGDMPAFVWVLGAIGAAYVLLSTSTFVLVAYRLRPAAAPGGTALARVRQGIALARLFLDGRLASRHAVALDMAFDHGARVIPSDEGIGHRAFGGGMFLVVEPGATPLPGWVDQELADAGFRKAEGRWSATAHPDTRVLFLHGKV